MYTRRVFALYAAILLGFAVVLCRLYWLANNGTYAQRAAAQSSAELALPARRGGFYDCGGLPLTGLEQGWLALCLPGEGSYARLYKYTTAEGQARLYGRRNVSTPFLLEVSADLSAIGVRCYGYSKRYSTAPLCSHLIGYVDGEGHGVAGLEAAFDELLCGTGESDRIYLKVNAQGRLQDGTEPELVRAAGGTAGVKLTISRPVQRAAEAVAAETMTTGCILVLDTASAEVRASVSVPGYDPADVAASLDAAGSPLLNRVLQPYAVGSVFKPVLAAAALEQGKAELVADCAGYIAVDGQIFRCAGGTAHGEVALAGALQKSCNGYFIRLGQALGVESVRAMASAMGFGRACEVAGGLRAAAGILPDKASLASSGQFANFCFGQGQLLATPVQVAAMMNTIACGGVWREPAFIKCVIDEDTGEELRVYGRAGGRRVISEQTAAELRTLLCGVVAEGTGREAAPEQGTAGGKTGTAQTGQFAADGSELKNLWFAGFWPGDKPRYTIAVLQDSQLEPEYSSAAIFAQVCRALALLS